MSPGFPCEHHLVVVTGELDENKATIVPIAEQPRGPHEPGGTAPGYYVNTNPGFTRRPGRRRALQIGSERGATVVASSTSTPTGQVSTRASR